MKKINILAMLAALCAVGAAFAQEQRPSITGIELSAGPRGLILTLSGTGPIALGAKPGDLEKVTASYPELRVNIANARSGLGAPAFAGPEQLPVREISLTESAGGVMLSVKMRKEVRGPVDVRSGTNQVRILLTKDPQPEMTWSPPAPPPPEGSIRHDPVDMKKVEERAAKDVQASGGEMFTVRDNPAARGGNTPASAAAAPAPAPTPAPQIAPRTEAPSAEAAEEDAPPAEQQPQTLREELVRYKVHGRDPFVPLVKDTATTDLPRVENLRLVGVLEDYRERIALVEDFKNDNRAFALRANDQVEYGKVLRVQRDRVVFLIRDFDVSRSYVLTLSAP